MITEIQIIAITDKGVDAINKMLVDDIKETTYNKSKVVKQWELKTINDNPLTYSARLRQEGINIITGNAKRIGHIAKIDNSILIDTFMNSAKSNTLVRMRTNGATYKVDYKIVMIDSDEEDSHISPTVNSFILDTPHQESKNGV
jgi:hypothetical protein